MTLVLDLFGSPVFTFFFRRTLERLCIIFTLIPFAIDCQNCLKNILGHLLLGCGMSLPWSIGGNGRSSTCLCKIMIFCTQSDNPPFVCPLSICIMPRHVERQTIPSRRTIQANR